MRLASDVTRLSPTTQAKSASSTPRAAIIQFALLAITDESESQKPMIKGFMLFSPRPFK